MFGTKKSCTCELCKSACHNNPGIFSPDEAEKALAAGHARKIMLDAEAVQVDGKALPVKYLIPAVPYYGGKVHRETPRSIFDFMLRGRGRCAFLTRADRCRIHGTDFKPTECRKALCCTGKGGMSEAARDALILKWNTKKGQSVIRRWREAVGSAT